MQKKLISSLLDFKRLTKGRTNELTDRADYYGPHRLNQENLRFFSTFKELFSNSSNKVLLNVPTPLRNHIDVNEM